MPVVKTLARRKTAVKKAAVNPPGKKQHVSAGTLFPKKVKKMNQLLSNAKLM